MKLGFNQLGDQYTINSPICPTEWSNFYANSSYVLNVSQTLQGNSQCLEPIERIINRGYRYTYILDETSQEVFNPNYVPLCKELDSYECTHGLGHTKLTSKYKDIQTTIKAYVPLEGSFEVWQYKIKNCSNDQKKISIFNVQSFEGGGMGILSEYDQEQQIILSQINPYHIKYEDKEKTDSYNTTLFMFSDEPCYAYDGDERRFFGNSGRLQVPSAIIEGKCSNISGMGFDSIGAMQHRYRVESGDEITFSIVFGYAKDKQEAIAFKDCIMNKSPEKYLDEVKQYWGNLTSKIMIKTPDIYFDHFMNFWMKKQLVVMNKTHRYSNLSCIRNELQDAMGLAMIEPKEAKKYIVNVLKNHESNGYIKQWHMLNAIENERGLATLEHKDGPVWLGIVLCEYIYQSQDFEFLYESYAYKDNHKQATVYDHMMQIIDYLYNDVGAHKLCLMGDGDWNDPINGAGRLGKGESAWTTMGLKYFIERFIPIVAYIGKSKDKEELIKKKNSLGVILNESCWDGQWYLRGYDDEGNAFGCQQDEEGKIFLNAQTWAIMSQTATGERQKKCLETIDALETPLGPKVLFPAFTKWHKRIGKLTLKRKGTSENGAIYCHASMFKAYADCLTGRGQKAYETLVKTLPTYSGNPVEHHGQLPIFVPNYYFGEEDHPNFGRSSLNNSTGTCGWFLWVGIEYLLGVKATLGGLMIDPCMPEKWTQYQVTRHYLDATYHIEFNNPKQKSAEAFNIEVDGKPIEGKVLPYKKGMVFEVKVIIN